MTTTSADVTALIRLGFAWRLEWSGTISAGATVRVGLVTAAQGALILDRVFTTDGDDTTFTLYRSTAWTGGVTLVPMNRSDRHWAATARQAVTSAASGVTATPSAANKMGAIRLYTVGPKSASATGEGSEIDLAPSTSYVIDVTNNDAESCSAAMTMLLIRDQMSTGVLSRSP